MKGHNLLGQIYANCEELGECMCWKGAMSGGSRRPAMWLDGRSQPVRAVVYTLSSGKPAPSGRFPVVDCDPRCVNEEHLKLRTRAQVNRKTAERYEHTVGWRAAIAASVRKSPKAKLSMELVREIRASEESAVAIAARVGVHPDTILRARNHDSWRELMVGASVFSQA